MYVQVEIFVEIRDCSIVQLTLISSNTFFSKSQKEYPRFIQDLPKITQELPKYQNGILPC